MRFVAALSALAVLKADVSNGRPMLVAMARTGWAMTMKTWFGSTNLRPAFV